MAAAELETCFLAGASGSIGSNVLSVLAHLNAQAEQPKLAIKRKRYVLTGLAVYKNTAWLKEILSAPQSAPAAQPAVVTPEHLQTLAIANAAARHNFKQFLVTVPAWKQLRVYASTAEAMAASPADTLINALSGSAGLPPTVIALETGMRVLLANKESLVMGTMLIPELIARQKTTLSERIVPIDSEHKSLQTLMRGYQPHELSRYILTASGGPFWQRPLANPKPSEALAHPNWDMGAKISIDSATMMNKGLELIEAHVLFKIPYTQLSAIIHKEQMIHAIIELVNGEQIALMGANDMRYAIQGAFTYPELSAGAYKSFSLSEHTALSFHPIPAGRYPLFELACACGKASATLPTLSIVMNAANEAYVYAFLAEQLSFNAMLKGICTEVELYERTAHSADSMRTARSLSAIMELDQEIKTRVQTQLKRKH